MIVTSLLKSMMGNKRAANGHQEGTKRAQLTIITIRTKKTIYIYI